jgi:hypothetical protein
LVVFLISASYHLLTDFLFARNKQKQKQARKRDLGLNVVDFEAAEDQFHHHEFHITPSAHRYQHSWLVEEKMLSTFANKSPLVVSSDRRFFLQMEKNQYIDKKYFFVCFVFRVDMLYDDESESINLLRGHNHYNSVLPF